MFIPDKAKVEKILLQMEEANCIDSRYRFVREKDGLKLLGVGGFSYVYEMEDSLSPNRHYAAKILGLGSTRVEEVKSLRNSRSTMQPRFSIFQVRCLRM